MGVHWRSGSQPLTACLGTCFPALALQGILGKMGLRVPSWPWGLYIH